MVLQEIHAILESKPMNMSASKHFYVISLLLGELLEEKDNKRVETPQEAIVHQALDLINLNSHVLYNGKDLACALEVSREHLSRSFKKQMGENLYDYIIKVKVQQCARRLLATTEAIKRIAVESGFPSSEQFGYVFKKQTGFTPSQFRRRRT
jgi:two-component system response regulator YesN